MTIVQTDRLILRTLKEEDIEMLMHIWGDEHVMKFCGGAGNKESEIKALKFYIDLHLVKGYSPYAVILKESNTLIGVCGFNPPHDGGAVELMYHLNKAHWGNGYATEAAKACLDYAQSNLKFAKVAAFIDPANQGSENILRKLGFTYKGEEWHRGSMKKEPLFELTL